MDPDSFEVIDTQRDVDIATLTASPRSVAKKALDLGWLVQANTSVTHHPDELMTADGKEKQRGEVKTPAHDKTHTYLGATHPQGSVGFTAWWTNGKFNDAIVADPLGIEVENWADYSPPASEFRRARDEPQAAFERRVAEVKNTAARREYDYNDGTFRTTRVHRFGKATDFTEWLNELLRVVAPDKAPKKKAAPAATEQIGEWNE